MNETPGAPPLVLLHGLGQAPMAWEDVVPLLYRSRPLLTPWVPGTRPIDRQALSVPDAAAALDQQLMLEGKATVDVCGLSLGAMVALQLAADFPDRVNRLVLIGAQVRLPRAAMAVQRRLMRLMPRERFLRANVSKERILQLLDVLRVVDLTEAAGRVRAPTLVLCGARDRANLPACRRLAELIPGATLQLVPDAGHEVNVQAPQALAELLTGFLDD